MDKLYAQVALTTGAREIDRLFSYGVPQNLSGLELGQKVLVPFGKGNRLAEGFVLGFTGEVDFDRVKNIRHIVDGPVRLTDEQMQLICWLRETYLCTFAEAIGAIVPSGTALKKQVLVKRSPDFSQDDTLPENWTDITDLSQTEATVRKWIRDGRAVEREQFTIGVKEQQDPIIRLNGAVEDILADIPERNKVQRLAITLLGRSKTGMRQSQLIRQKGITSAVLRRLAELNHVSIETARKERRPDFYRKDEKKDIVLNADQQAAYESVLGSMDLGGHETWLLHGVTGSGKTEIYLNLMEHVIEEGKQGLVLVPEISLTPQIVNKFLNRFGDQVAVFHSRLSVGERYDQWVAVKEGRLPIVIGARSALFAPVENLGLIIIDEEHDNSYKSDMSPKYHAVDVAQFLGNIHKAPVLLGTATPSVESYERHRRMEYGLLELSGRFAGQQMPDVQVVDMREELEMGNRTIFSGPLFEAINERLARKEQIILFLNRKGHSTFVSCRSCGFSLKCPNCDISLTYHKGAGHVSCSYCGYQIAVPKRCPSCKSKYFKYFGTGTEKVEELTAQAFPGARIGRMDKASTSRKGALETLIEKFDRHELDILIGTQMVTKGLDFHNVTLVGVLSADVLLNLPDYLASERAFQLLTQVAGRAGRGDQHGEVIIQTYTPDHYAVQTAADHDFHAFFESELGVRQLYGYPPYGLLANILISGTDEGAVVQTAHRLKQPIEAEFIKKGLKKTEVLGPNPAIYSKMKGRHRWQILVRYDDGEQITVREILRRICLVEGRKKKAGDVYISVDIKARNIL